MNQPPPPPPPAPEPSNQPQASGQVIDEGRGRVFPCDRCGNDLRFHIGQQQLQCPFCHYLKTIDLDDDAQIEEQDFHAALVQLESLKKGEIVADEEHNEVRCDSCGGNVLFDGTLTSSSCPYCGSPIQREKIHRGGFRIPVDAVLPFQIEKTKAQNAFANWISSRWYAPNDFKHAAETKAFQGVYLPFWTFDSMIFTRFVGERGQTYTTGVGKNRVQRVRWSSASGQFQKFFDDQLVNATHGLPVKHINSLGPWPLQRCQPFQQEYLAGLLARTYDIDLDHGFEIAKFRMEQDLRSECHRRIGGDRQRIHSMKCRYDAISYKHLLLPVWMLAYRYRGKSYRVFVNAVTGRVEGDRPFSWVKITFTILTVLAILAAIAFFKPFS